MRIDVRSLILVSVTSGLVPNSEGAKAETYECGRREYLRNIVQAARMGESAESKRMAVNTVEVWEKRVRSGFVVQAQVPPLRQYQSIQHSPLGASVAAASGPQPYIRRFQGASRPVQIGC